MSRSIQDHVLMGKNIAEDFFNQMLENEETPLTGMFIASVVLSHLTNLAWVSAPPEMKKHVSGALKMAVVTIIETAKANGVETDLIPPDISNEEGLTRNTHIVDNNGVHSVN